MPAGDAIIEINGKKYNAETGQQLSSGQVTHTSEQKRTRGLMIDGFSAPHKTRKKTPPATALHQAQQKSKKLHAAAAKKSAPKAIKAVATKTTASSEANSQVASHRAAFINEKRADRAKQYQKSQSINKFSQLSQMIQAAASPTVDTTPAVQVPTPRVEAQPEPRRPEPADVPAEEKIKQPNWFSRMRQRQPKLLPTVAGVAVVLLLAGYVTYLNLPNMALRVAASRAGFDASLPGYKPAGFSLDGPIAYSPGQITIQFSSNSDERTFTLAQRESTWDSQSLLDNYVVRENKKYATFQEKGLTVYVYDNSNATWVDGGIWYTITGDSLLSSEQLLKIAGSL